MVAKILGVDLTLNLFVIATILAYFHSHVSTLNIKGAIIIFRHGDRAPWKSYPNDPHKHYRWPGGYGALIETGIRQMYDTGVKFNSRYRSLMPRNGYFKQSSIRIRSSAVPRCLMSAQSFMSGFLPPPKKWVLPIDWQPVLIESIPRNQDSMIAQEKRCSKYDHSFWDALRIDNPIMTAFMESKNLSANYLSELVGMPIKTADSVIEMIDTIIQEKRIGLKIPDWAQDMFNDTLIPLYQLCSKQVLDTSMNKIRAGTLLNEIVNYLEKFALRKINRQRLYVISGHDITIMSFASLLGFYKQLPRIVDFACTLTLEIYDNTDLKDDFEIKFFFFKDYADENPIEIDIPGCVTPCKLSNFKEAVESKIVYDYDRFCRNYQEDNLYHKDNPIY